MLNIKNLFLSISVLIFANIALAGPCADTVSQAKRNGVYKHFLKVTGGKRVLKLRRAKDGQKVTAGISGNRFQVIGHNVKVCKTGSLSISASNGGINGSVKRTTHNGKTAYIVEAPFGFGGLYLPR